MIPTASQLLLILAIVAAIAAVWGPPPTSDSRWPGGGVWLAVSLGLFEAAHLV